MSEGFVQLRPGAPSSWTTPEQAGPVSLEGQ